MRQATNPFPQYAVARLAVDSMTGQPTIETGPIIEARKRVKDYAAAFGSTAPAPASLNAVRGDYGSGKTHLLFDAAATLQLVEPTATVLRLTCIEADPLAWFAAKVGPELDKPFLRQLAIQLFARAGVKVAGLTKLTGEAGKELVNDPDKIAELIHASRLSGDAVEREFDLLLAAIQPKPKPSAIKAFRGLVWNETEPAARRWLSARTLESRDRGALGVEGPISDSDEAAALLGFVAGVHAALGRPLIVLIDELEHFTRHDISHNAWKNLTWLKRLLELLGSTSAMVFVAGHWDAWKATRDYLDRFPQLPTIDLLRPSPVDVSKLVHVTVPSATSTFGAAQSSAVLEATGGNMRRIVSLCAAMFRHSDGFARVVDPTEVQSIWGTIAHHLPREQALVEFQDALQNRGFNVEMDAVGKGSKFELVASHGGEKLLVVDVEHATRQIDLHDRARRFLNDLQELEAKAPRVVGCFLVDGNVDDEFLKQLREGPQGRVRWFDLTDRDVLAKIANVVESVAAMATGPVGSAPPTGAPGPALAGIGAIKPAAASGGTQQDSIATTLATQLATQRSEFERTLRELEERREKDLAALYSRLNESRTNAVNPRERELLNLKNDNPSALGTYEELTRAPTWSGRMRMVPSVQAYAFALAGSVCALALSFMPFADPVFPSGAFKIATEGYLAACALAAGWMIWRINLRFDETLEVARSVLRSLYLRDATNLDLVMADELLRDKLRSQRGRLTRSDAYAVLHRANWQSQSAREFVQEHARAEQSSQSA